jgi:hypothetical protein
MKAVLTIFLALGGVLFGAVLVGVAVRLIAFFTRIDWLLTDSSGAERVVTVLLIIGAVVGAAIGGLCALALHRSAKTRWLSYSIAVSGFLLVAWLLWPRPPVYLEYSLKATYHGRFLLAA